MKSLKASFGLLASVQHLQSNKAEPESFRFEKGRFFFHKKNLDIWVFPNIGGKPPKMDGLQWKNPIKMDDLGGGFTTTPIFGLTAIVSPSKLVTEMVQEVGPVKPAQDRLGAQKPRKRWKLHIKESRG